MIKKMTNKKLKKTLISTTALGLAVSSFFSTTPNDIEVSFKDNKEVRDAEENKYVSKTKVGNKDKHIFTREDIAKMILSIGSIVAILIKTIFHFIIGVFKTANSHSLLISTILDTISIFIIIFVLFIVLFKLIYPERNLKELLTFKNIIVIFFASLFIAIILNNLDLFEKQKILMIIIEAIASSIVLFGTYAYVLHSNSKILFGPKALIKTRKGRRTILVMFISIIVGTITKILLTKFNILVPITNILLIVILVFGLAVIVVSLRKKKLVNYSIEFPENVID